MSAIFDNEEFERYCKEISREFGNKELSSAMDDLIRESNERTRLANQRCLDAAVLVSLIMFGLLLFIYI